MGTSKAIAILCTAALMGLPFVRSAQSADLSKAAEQVRAPDQWVLTVTPYGWVTWLNGDQTVRGRTVKLDVNPIELIRHLDSVPFMGYAEARKGPIAFYTDIFYADLGLGASSVKSRSLHPDIGGTLSAAAGLDFQQAIVEVGGAYEVMRGQTAVDLLAGARYWHQDASLKLNITGTLDVSDLILRKDVALARSGSVDWVDPVIGARIRHHVGPGKELVLRADIGGFGVGSQFSWNALAAYSWEIAVRDGVIYSGVLGYRALAVDYEQGSGRTKYEYDVLQHGPITGLTMKF